MASNQDKFDAASEAFRDLFEGLYDIDTGHCARGVTSDDAPGVKLIDGQGAPGQRLTVAIMLPGRQLADDWLDFMLSQKNLWPTFTTRGALTEEITEKTLRKE